MRIALAGNPNSGKTTLFNAITGEIEHVGNWPGVTVAMGTLGQLICREHIQYQLLHQRKV